ncbi:hypothetical protein RYH80_02630 [Halobaculum sp. MBLA0147]|uniref:DUF7113 family protein n=1 Tax=Halobaculum sp. MBLA0147 TaxID=3079934 RepID=UPI0035268181
MLLVRGRAGGTALTGTIYERGEEPPSYKGAPDGDEPYVWVCDAFYEVHSGGSELELDGRTVNVAFESPMPRGFETREAAVTAAEDHVRTQFARVGLDAAAVEVEVVEQRPGADAHEESPAGVRPDDADRATGALESGETDDEDEA